MSKPVVCVVGCDGNMGRRYLACLSKMDVSTWGYDLRRENNSFHSSTTHYIVATPTSTHISALYDILEHQQFFDKKASVLCEKPMSFCQGDNKNIFDDFDQVGCKLFMVNNYAYYPLIEGIKGPTSYDYYHSGNDGLPWDCIQLLALAKGEVKLSNQSPVWRVEINGTPISRNLIDETYLDMLYDFIFGARESKLWGRDEVLSAHKKVSEYIEGAYF